MLAFQATTCTANTLTTLSHNHSEYIRSKQLVQVPFDLYWHRFVLPKLPTVIRIVQVYPAISNPRLGIFFGLTPLLGVKGYSYLGWPLGQPAPALPSTFWYILAGQREAKTNFKVYSHTLAPPPWPVRLGYG